MKKILIGIVWILSLFIIACKSDSEVLDCSTISGATFKTNGGQLESIINTKCAGPACHSPGGSGSNHWFITGNGALGDHFFDEALEVIMDGSMPPAGSPKLTNTELNQFECWSKAGYPE